MLGIRTQGRRIVCADKTTELWRPPRLLIFAAYKSFIYTWVGSRTNCYNTIRPTQKIEKEKLIACFVHKSEIANFWCQISERYRNQNYGSLHYEDVSKCIVSKFDKTVSKFDKTVEVFDDSLFVKLFQSLLQSCNKSNICHLIFCSICVIRGRIVLDFFYLVYLTMPNQHFASRFKASLRFLCFTIGQSRPLFIYFSLLYKVDRKRL